MSRQVVTVHPGGRFTLPAAIRHELDLHPGDTVVWFERDGELLFRKAQPHEVESAESDTEDHASSSDDAKRQKD